MSRLDLLLPACKLRRTAGTNDRLDLLPPCEVDGLCMFKDSREMASCCTEPPVDCVERLRCTGGNSCQFVYVDDELLGSHGWHMAALLTDVC